MRVVAGAGREDVALVYLAETKEGKWIEFVESLQPPLPREHKWVLTISTLYGCPVRCRFCDAGGSYRGKVSRDDIIAQIDYLIMKRFPEKKVPVKKFKVQFARMGEPSLNPHVLEVLDILPGLYGAPGLIPSLSSVAPKRTDGFFEKLLDIKKEKYPASFQMQFSIHTTDEKARGWLIPVDKWDFDQIAGYGMRFYNGGGKKITLNFALMHGMAVDPDILRRYFSPDIFLIKITPLNPTYQAAKHRLTSHLPQLMEKSLVSGLEKAGYEVMVSTGELEENRIGSNCGMYITKYKKDRQLSKGSYTYRLESL